MSFRRVTISEFAASINGGVDVDKMYLARMGYESKNKCKVYGVGGKLTYQMRSGNAAIVQSGDVLYLKNGETVELL